MKLSLALKALGVGLGGSIALQGSTFQPSDQLLANSSCQPGVLERLTRHRVVAGETLEKIAQKYQLLPTTLMGLNPAVRSGSAAVGSEILVPPFNGIRVELQAGESLRDLAQRYGVRADVLFEVNGCIPRPRAAFIPGVNWSPGSKPGPGRPNSAKPETVITTYPLRGGTAEVLLKFGYGLRRQSETVGYHAGLDLAAEVGVPVVAAGPGTVAFVGQQGAYGNLVVINHAEGLQSRYAQLKAIAVQQGQSITAGTVLGSVGQTGQPSSSAPHLHFEVRSRSSAGWVAQDPTLYLPKP